MVLTLVGIVVFIHPKISVFVAVSIIALQLFRESYAGLPDATTMLVNPEQLAKAKSPMLVTPSGMLTFVNPEQL